MAIRTKQCYKSIAEDHSITRACHLTNNLYNEANYLVRQEFFTNRKWIRYSKLNKLLKSSSNYKDLPAQTAQQILRLLEQNWKAFFASMKEWVKDSSKFLGRPRPPKYHKKGAKFLIILTNQQFRIQDDYIVLPKKLGEVKLNKMDMIADKIKGIRIIPVINELRYKYSFEILYERDIPTLKENSNRIAGIDLGINNLITMVNNVGDKPIIIKGGVIKSLNQYYNKRKSKLQSIYDKQGSKNGTGKKLLKLSFKRKKQMKDKLHKASRFVINWCITNKIDTLVVGYNKTWKQKIKIGKRNNQNFTNIPFHTLINQLKYKCEEEGIHFITVNESYTSKCSFLDNEPIKKQHTYQGKRICRGLFKSAKGLLINADVNAACNILRKVFPKAFYITNGDIMAKEIVGNVLYPECYNL